MRAAESSEELIEVEAPALQKPASTVKKRLTGKRSRHSVETMEYLGAARRFIRAAGRRVADADEIELAELLNLRHELDQAITEAIRGQRALGRSWAYIARATGTTREAAFQRWNR